MQPSSLSTILNTLLTILMTSFIGVLGWFIKSVLNRVSDMNDKLTKHIEEDLTAQTTHTQQLISSSKLIEKLDQRFDRFEERMYDEKK